MILAEYTEFTGNFPAIAAQCLQKLPSSNNKFTYNCDHHTFNFLVEDGYAIYRGENLTTLADKTENLRDQAQAYRKQGTQIRHKMWYQNMKIKLVVLGILILLILIIWLSVCHGFDCAS